MQWFIQDVNIGKNLRSLREQHGYSQYRLVIKLHLMGAICHAALIPKSKLALGIYGLATFSP